MTLAGFGACFVHPPAEPEKCGRAVPMSSISAPSGRTRPPRQSKIAAVARLRRRRTRGWREAAPCPAPPNGWVGRPYFGAAATLCPCPRPGQGGLGVGCRQRPWMFRPFPALPIPESTHGKRALRRLIFRPATRPESSRRRTAVIFSKDVAAKPCWPPPDRSGPRGGRPRPTETNFLLTPFRVGGDAELPDRLNCPKNELGGRTG